MRLWHYKLIPYLPRQQLLGQYRELCLIVKNIFEHEIPGHMLVNKILDYDDPEINAYAVLVIDEMVKRGYRVNQERYWKWISDKRIASNEVIFRWWHNDRYLRQCMANLQEKYDCDGMTDCEWSYLMLGYKEITGEEYV